MRFSPDHLQRRAVAMLAAFLLLFQTGYAFSEENTNLFALQPLCFEGEADYTYQNDHLAIHIKRFVEEIDQVDLRYHIADVQISDPSFFMTALSQDKKDRQESVPDLANRVEAVLAINADYCGFAPTKGVIIRNGELLRSRSAPDRNLLIVDKNGSMSVIVDRTQEKAVDLAARLVSESVWQTFEFGPELVRDGTAVAFSKQFTYVYKSNKAREPRMAIGQIGKLHYMIIVVDGRKNSPFPRGMSLQELQAVFVEHGASVAFNLDGGSSATMYFMGELLNKPSAGRPREVSDIIYFK